MNMVYLFWLSLGHFVHLLHIKVSVTLEDNFMIIRNQLEHLWEYWTLAADTLTYSALTSLTVLPIIHFATPVPELIIC
jgi:hypothetical protein